MLLRAMRVLSLGMKKRAFVGIGGCLKGNNAYPAR